jgi:hypothetical protein
MRLPIANLLWFGLYTVTLVSVIMALSFARHRAISRLETVEAQAEWEAWQAEAGRQAQGAGPVRRRVPRGGESPELVLLRDYFWVCTVGLCLLTTALFLTFMFMIRGVVAGRRFQVRAE